MSKLNIADLDPLAVAAAMEAAVAKLVSEKSDEEVEAIRAAGTSDDWFVQQILDFNALVGHPAVLPVWRRLHKVYDIAIEKGKGKTAITGTGMILALLILNNMNDSMN